MMSEAVRATASESRTIEISFIWTWREAYRALRRSMACSRGSFPILRFIKLGLFGAMLFYGIGLLANDGGAGDWQQGAFFTAVSLWFLVGRSTYIKLAMMMSFRHPAPEHNARVRIEISEAGVTRAFGENEAESIAWSEMERTHVFRDGVLLVAPERDGVWLPRGAFDSPEALDRVREMAERGGVRARRAFRFPGVFP